MEYTLEPLFFIGCFSVVPLVMAIGNLCGGHGFALADIDRIDDLAILVDYLVGTRLGTDVSAIESHVFTSDSPSICGL